MEALRIFTRVEKDGEISLSLSNLPIKEGQQVEVLVLGLFQANTYP